ncbi:MAG: hypothetical protein PUP93_33290 [Rhizonema sp. NSF051]|nr:hypothetical protein [Rhizonema sp. NSF051]
MEALEAKIKALGKKAAMLSNEAVRNRNVLSRKERLDLMRQARDASRECQALIQELKRQQAA